MSLPTKSPITSESVARYVTEHITFDKNLEKELREETWKLANARMISSSDVGAFLNLTARGIKTRKAIEVGTFTGYTALKIAQALPSDGQLVCCDINEEWTNIGKKYWEKAGLSDRIDLRLAPAIDTLSELLATGQKENFDFAFIDADKAGYESYYEKCLELIRPGGLIILDNMLWKGLVVEALMSPYEADKIALTLHALNKKISEDQRVESCLLTLGDGLMLAYKK